MPTLLRGLAAVTTRVPALLVALTLAVTFGLAAAAATVEEATGQDGFAPDSDEVAASDRISALFGSEQAAATLQVVVQPGDADLLGTETVTAVANLYDALGQADGVAADQLPTSFLTPVFAAAEQSGQDPRTWDGPRVRRAFEDTVAAAGAEFAFLDQLLTDDGIDGAAGLVVVTVEDTGDLNKQIAVERAVADVVEGQATDQVRLDPFSFALLFDDDAFDFLDEVAQLFALAAALIVVLLLFVFWVKPDGSRWWRSARRMAADVSVTMTAIVLAVIWTNGIGALLQRAGVIGEVTEVAQIVPVLLVGLGVDYGIHLISRYRDEVGTGATPAAATRTAVSTVGAALALATVTTAVGFLANLTSPIPALQDFGVLAAVGIVAAFVLMLTFVPALRILLDRRGARRGTLPTDGLAATGQRLLPALIARTAVLANRAPARTLTVAALLGVAGGYGMVNISTEFSVTDFLPEDLPAVETLMVLEDAFAGGFGERTDVLIEADEIDTGLLAATGEATAAAANVDGVATVELDGTRRAAATSWSSMLQQVAAVPEVAAALADVGFDPQTGTLADGSDVDAFLDVAEQVADGQWQQVVAREDAALLLRFDTRAGEDGATELQAGLLGAFAVVEEAGAQVTVTSEELINATIIDRLADSQLWALLVTLLVATAVLTLAFWRQAGRPLLGVLTMLPVALVVLWTFGLMYLSGIPFGPVTATLTGLAVGIGVPYTIHMARRFEEDRLRYDWLEDAIEATTRNTGGALAGSALTTAVGFGVLTTSSLVPFQQMGQVTAYAITLALAGAVLVLPSLLVLWERWHRVHDPTG